MATTNRSIGANSELAKVSKTGIYRDPDTGHGLYLVAGEDHAKAMLDRYKFDGDGTKAQAERREAGPSYFTGVVKADPAMANKAEAAPANKSTSGGDATKTDAELAGETAGADGK